ncbi:MAG: hypothetical protein AAFP70_03140 [Calditrichota bacterium]
MTLDDVFADWAVTSHISNEQAIAILNDFRMEALIYIRSHPNREFAKALLENVVLARKNEVFDLGITENLMYAAYLLTMHAHIEDALHIWRAKTVDFDTYCGFDVELIVFAGYAETLDYLKQESSEEALEAAAYILACGEPYFDNLDQYFSKDQLPWWI